MAVKKNLIVFDIDGTLTDTVAAHQTAFKKCLELIGIEKFNDAFGSYLHHTDTHIARTIFEHATGRAFDAPMVQTFEDYLCETIGPNEIKEIAGAKRLVDFLEQETDFGVCYATGSLKRAAQLKLERIGISFDPIQLVASNEIEERERIVQTAIAHAKKHYKVAAFDRILSFGDGLWDLKTAKNLSLEFVGVGPSHYQLLRDHGMEKHFHDLEGITLNDLEAPHYVGTTSGAQDDRLPSQQGIEMQDFHIGPLLKVLGFIDEHLEQGLPLDRLALVGHYSPFHFHRLFKAYMNESPNDYVTRKRIEKIASLLIREPSKKISELLFLYGFSSHASLTKTFKRYYHLSPTAFRRLGSSRYDKIINSKNGQKPVKIERYICHIDNLKNWIAMNANVSVKDVGLLKMVYVNHIGVQDLDVSFLKIIDWALRKDLVGEKEMQLVRIYHDSFKVTDPDKVRMEIGVLINGIAAVESDIRYKEFRPQLCIVGSFEIGLPELEKAWSSMFIWMNENGYRTRAERPFEIIHNDYREHPQQKSIMDLYIPVQ